MPAVPSPLDPVTDAGESTRTAKTSVASTWYDPDASSWEPQPPVCEALRASAPRPPIAMGPGRLTSARRTAAARPTSQARPG